MKSYRSRALLGALALAVLLPSPRPLCAQKQVSLTVTVTDSADAAISGASVQKPAGHLLGHTDASGRFTFECEIPCRVRIDAEGFIGNYFELTANQTVHLERAGATEEITVTAYREPLGELESPVTTRTLSANALTTTAAITLDDEVRQLPGVELFRRSSSLVANPTSQGISVRGLGSTSASRTLVTQDDVPLNDPIGGWIHWEEQPELAIQSAELVRGGASDLYGSSAIGGVLNMITVRPTTDLVEVRSSYGGEGTYDTSALAETKHGPWGLLAAGGTLGTDGYIQEAPSQRGPVDIASNMHSQNGLFVAEHERGPLRFFARGSGFNEARGNGTPFQTNGTRLWRYATGGDWQRTHGDSAVLRVYGSTEHYRQTFSSIVNTPNYSESNLLLSLRRNPFEVRTRPGQRTRRGHALDAARRRGPRPARRRRRARRALLGSRADLSAPPRSSPICTIISATPASTPKASGCIAHGPSPPPARIDWFQNYDGHAAHVERNDMDTLATQPPNATSASSIRAWASRANFCSTGLSRHRASAPFAHPRPASSTAPPRSATSSRCPTATCSASAPLAGKPASPAEWHWGTIRSSYFLTQVNRPIVAVTTNPNFVADSARARKPRPDRKPRRRSRFRTRAATLARRSTAAISTRMPSSPAVRRIYGNWIPEVARNMATLNLRAYKPRLGTLSLQSRLSGHQFDDDANLFLLHGYFRLDAYASHDIGNHLQLFAAGENLFDRDIEVSKTPTTTLGMPRVARAGLQIRLSPESK